MDGHELEIKYDSGANPDKKLLLDGIPVKLAQSVSVELNSIGPPVVTIKFTPAVLKGVFRGQIVNFEREIIDGRPATISND
jgi:hypothetical protein